MCFKIGDIVKFGDAVNPTVIATPTNNPDYFLVGWKKGYDCFGWRLVDGADVLTGFGQLSMIRRAFAEFGTAYWVTKPEITLVRRSDTEVKIYSYPPIKLFSRISPKRLQKRARDQAAQQFLISKG